MAASRSRCRMTNGFSSFGRRHSVTRGANAMLKSKLFLVGVGLMVLSIGVARAEDALKPDDDGFIRNWLVLAPIPNGENVSGTDALNKEFISGEANLKPKADEKAKIGDLELTWKAISAGDYA